MRINTAPPKKLCSDGKKKNQAFFCCAVKFKFCLILVLKVLLKKNVGSKKNDENGIGNDDNYL